MKYLRSAALPYVALLALLTLPLTYSQAQVRVGVGIGVGVGPGYVAGPPVCSYGYYPDAPYGCAPYGYYGPSWFANGIFIGAGPWYHGWGHPFYGRSYARGFDGRFAGGRFNGRGPVGRRGFEGRGSVASVRGESHGGSHGGGSRGRR
jgi:hypothetical protein